MIIHIIFNFDDTLLLNQVDDTLLLILTAQAEKLVTCK